METKRTTQKYPLLCFILRERRPHYTKKAIPSVTECLGDKMKNLKDLKILLKNEKKIRTDKMQKDVLWESKKMRKVLPGDMRCL